MFQAIDDRQRKRGKHHLVAMRTWQIS
jgi:hypothetical protein